MSRRYFLDTEFIEDGKSIDLLSLALVRDDDRYLYLLNKDADLNCASDWVIYNVYPHLPVTFQGGSWQWTHTGPHRALVCRADMRAQIRSWITSNAEFWGYYADYDWVVFCQLFGRMVDLPAWFPKYCMDLQQLLRTEGLTKDALPKQEGAAHNALEDARWIKQSYEFITKTGAYDPLVPLVLHDPAALNPTDEVSF